MSDDTDRKTRRTFLSAVGVTAASAGVGSIVDADGIVGARERQQVAVSYRLGGLTAAWQGRAPESIADAANPTLNLEAGRDYEVTWENVDGAAHNFAILSDDGEVLVRTEIISQQGATQTTQFTATEDMSTYLCQVHPNTMVGGVVVGAVDQETTGNTTAPDGTATQATTARATENRTRIGAQETRTVTTDGTAAPTTTENKTRTGAQETRTTTTEANETAPPATAIPNPTEATVQETTHPLADEYGENPVKFIAPLRPPEGVQTDATGTAWFTLHPPNGSTANMLYAMHVESVENVTGVTIRLVGSGSPAVVRLYQPGHPTDVISGTLVDSEFTANDLSGPFQNGSLLRLVEAIRNDNAVVVVHTQQHPDGLLRGPIRTVAETGGETTIPSAAGNGTTGNETTTIGGTTAEEANATGETTTTGGTPTDNATTTTSTGDTTAADEIDAADVARQAPAPGFGVLTALGGIGGAMGYLLSRGGDDE